MRSDFPVVLDACVLVESALSDLLLRLSEEPRLLLPRWSREIWEEVHRTWVHDLGWRAELADSRRNAAIDAFPEAIIEGFEHLVPRCHNHPKDRHVLAAAIHARVEVIVTFNVKDFFPQSLVPFGIEAIHPSDFLMTLYDLDPAVVTNTLRDMATRINRTPAEMLARLAWYVRPFSSHVAKKLDVDLPTITPREWRRPEP